jgi:hypothetical protein
MVRWNALGEGLDDLRLEVDKARLHVGDILRLCTDGLPTHVPDGDLHALPQARETWRQRVEAATRAGRTDKITVIVAQLRDPVPGTVTAEEAAVAVVTPALWRAHRGG